jgi:hypothetical protein
MKQLIYYYGLIYKQPRWQERDLILINVSVCVCCVIAEHINLCNTGEY